ncbi:MAG: hypothetical protein IMX00_08320 [Limnochordales bacterium]|nr:hypothetical protein [Limnochordales bacterium]
MRINDRIPTPSRMTKLERFLAAIAGEEVDHVPACVWLHFASEHLPGTETARLHLRYFQEYDWDYLKVMNDYRYPLPGIEAIASEADLLRFEPQPLTAPPFAAQLECLRTLRAELGPNVPIIETIFSPVQTIIRAAGASAWKIITAHPQAACQMLEAVTQTLVSYVEACRELGVTGIFFSVNGANRPPAAGGTTDEEFATFIAPYDRRVLQAAAGLVRIGHIHGLDLAFDRVLDYPVEAFNWSHLRTPPSLAEVRQRTSAALIGGIDEVKVFDQTPAEVAASIERAWHEAGGRKFLVGPGCTVAPDTPRRILHAIAQVAHSLKSG